MTPSEKRQLKAELLRAFSNVAAALHNIRTLETSNLLSGVMTLKLMRENESPIYFEVKITEKM